MLYAWTRRPRLVAMMMAFVLATGFIVALGPAQPAWAGHFIGVEPKVDIVEYNAVSDIEEEGTGVFYAKVLVNSVWKSGGDTSPEKRKLPGEDFTSVTCDGSYVGGLSQSDVYYCPLPTSGTAGLHSFAWDGSARISTNFNVGQSSFSYEVGFYFDPANPDPEDSGWFGSPRFTSSLQTQIGGGQNFSQNLGGESPNTTKNTTLSYSFMEDSTEVVDKNGTPVSAENDDGGTGGEGLSWSASALGGQDLATVSSGGDLAISSAVSSHIAGVSNNSLAIKLRVEELDGDNGNAVVGFVTRDIGIEFITTDNTAPSISGFDANQEFRVVAGTDTATTFTISATDPDDDTVTVAVGGTFPDWATIGTATSSSSGGVSTTTRLVTLQPPSNAPNATINVEVTATDDGGPDGDVNLTASRSFKIIVVNAPTITETGDSQVAISWVNPTLEDGETLAGTKVQYSDDSGSNWSTFETLSGNGQASTITGLTNGTGYVFRTIPQIQSGGVTSDGTASSESEETTPRGSQSATWTLPPSQRTLLLSQSGLQIGSGLNAASASTAVSYSVSVAGDPNCALDGSNNLTFDAVGTCTLRASAAEQGAFLAATVDAELTIVLVRPVANNNNNGNNDDEETTAPVVASTPAVRAPARVDPPRPNANLTTTGPVLRGGVAPAPPRAPSALVGGRSVQTETSVTGGDQLNVRAGSVNLGVQVDQAQGRVVDGADGSRGLEVRKGSATTLRGSGLQPGSTVQIFLPLNGDDSKELAQIPVGQDGSFEGSAPFATRPQDAPLPIGPQTLQVVSLDEDGNQTVMEMTVNIAQPVPTPELNRVDGVIPTMAPGQSVATEAGVPVPVRVTAVRDQKLAVVEGDGWTMSVNVASPDGGVEPSEEGALLKLVRNETVEVSGGGFMPGTRSDVWLFSEPTLLGTVEIDSNGDFSGTLKVDPNLISAGEHTLQIQGVGDDGYVRSANLGVLVEDAQAAVIDTQEQSLAFLWWVIGLALLLAAAIGVGTWWYRRGRPVV
ncbi:periplasmic FN3 protein [Pontimonas salivibrio]|uniref:Periplasmic FN3 protein n=1 Tax=Pontimonas salivibrio TaxID=1159327 RepID=A0A2L2BNK7_9MICO|nr:fibronectin type III domain-containing protein [Pontimonas salivibrio]AVG23251.1 periplasmic FN3 protein [Pontimonas salivibrio]